MPAYLMAALTVSLCFIRASMAPAQVAKIKVGYSSIGVGQSLVWVAKEAGLFKENGLDVQLIFIGSSSTDSSRDRRRRADRDHVRHGGDRLAIGGIGRCHGCEHKERSSPGVSGHRKRNFTTRAAQGEKTGGEPARRIFGFYPQVDSQKDRLSAGQRRGDCQIGSSPVKMAALVNGAADGTALTFEEMMVAKKMGFNVMLNLVELGVESLNSDVVTTRKFMRESRETVQRFIKGMIKGVSFFAANKKFSMMLLPATPRATTRKRSNMAMTMRQKSFSTSLIRRSRESNSPSKRSAKELPRRRQRVRSSLSTSLS